MHAKIFTDDICNSTVEAGPAKHHSEQEAKLCEPYLDVSTFLNYMSLEDYSDYCLAYTFSGRDFADGTLGLAWLAKASSSVGGVCERRQTFNGEEKSLNTGIVTLVNYRSRVPEVVAQLTFTHEVGHNFGAEHDPIEDTGCTPGTRKGGNYIMYRRATTGRDLNNRHFSLCSRDLMGPVVHSLVKNANKFCFVRYNGSLCGNGVVEEGEECDCGYEEDCHEQCCYHAGEDANKRCRLKPNAACSPSQGHCCNKDACRYEPPNHVCMRSTECLHNVKCTGYSSYCPSNSSVFFKKNLTSCNSGTQVCINGVSCFKSFKSKRNLINDCNNIYYGIVMHWLRL
jgi:disintegrin and metalloproteinase domain-containing protein 10